jgi:ABC-type sugar transport system permease subunit
MLKKISIKIEPYLYILPATILLCAVVIYPMLSSFRYALYEWSGLGVMKFVGFDNLYKILSGYDKQFWNSIKLTFEWVALSTVVLSFTGLVLAFIVEFGIRSRRFVSTVRTILFMPMMMSLVSVGLLWSLIYNPILGLLSKILSIIGLIDIQHPLNFLGSYNLVLFAIFIPVIWQWSGFGMVIFSAALQSIPDSVKEASIIDGANLMSQIRYIYIPLLFPKIMLVSTLNLIGAFKCFDIIYVLTAGGPGNASQVTTIYLFREAFVNNNYGYGSAISVVLFLIAIIFSIVFMRVTTRVKPYY